MSKQYFTALRGREAFTHFLDTNKNDANSYRSGYERYMDEIPFINKNDDDVAFKLMATHETILKLAEELRCQPWVWVNWPKPGAMLTRVILGIDADTGAQIVLVRWNIIETPIHGHAYGQMLDYLMHGTAAEVEYDIVDPVKRLVVQNGNYTTHCGPSLLSNNYYEPSTAERGALVHKFITQTKAITLHLIPEMPRDGKDNLFTEIKMDYAK